MLYSQKALKTHGSHLRGKNTSFFKGRKKLKFGLRIGMTEDSNCAQGRKLEACFRREESSVQKTNLSPPGTNPQVTFYWASPKAAKSSQVCCADSFLTVSRHINAVLSYSSSLRSLWCCKPILTAITGWFSDSDWKGCCGVNVTVAVA